jgi:hypothetical protein
LVLIDLFDDIPSHQFTLFTIEHLIDRRGGQRRLPIDSDVPRSRNKLIEQCIHSLRPTHGRWARAFDRLRARLHFADCLLPHVIKEIASVRLFLFKFFAAEPRFRS